MVVQGRSPRTGAAVGEPVAETCDAEVDRLCRAAAAAATELARYSLEQRATCLRAVADALDDAADELVEVADAETALGPARLTGELARTTAQLRLFATVVLDGGFLEATVDPPDPAAVPPRPDLRRMLWPIGPVAVFAASNFPFAFSVAGGDTASALAAGCPVVVKAHEAHPATSVRTAEVVTAALGAAGASEGTFGIVHGFAAGGALVRHPAVRAAGFTGSVRGGRALFDVAAARPEPIPFYGELGSVNPVVVLPEAARRRAGEIAAGFAGSLVLGAGQFCTNPGLVFAPDSLLPELAAAVEGSGGAPMLAERIRDGYLAGNAARAGHDEVELLATGTEGDGVLGVAPALYHVPLAAFRADPDRHVTECFGPSALVVGYPAERAGELPAALRLVPGSLTGTVHAEPGEYATAGRVADVLRERVGRLIFNGWPTGVAVSWAMHHGGPYPATTSPLHTSVGSTAVRRWLVPVSYQDWPADLLPAALRDGNPLGIPRRRDGVLAG